MEIKDLQPGQGSVNITATVTSVEEPKVIDKYGKQLKVTNAVISDGSGEIKLTLWNDDVDKVKPGITIKITNGYVNEFNGEKQLTSGKFGKLEIEGDTPNEETTEADSSPENGEEASETTTEPSVEEPENKEDMPDY